MKKISTNVNDVLITDLREITVNGGNVLKGLKQSDFGYKGFGEAYFTNIESGAIKAWKLHKKMTLNLIVPVGSVRFVIYDNREKSMSFQKFDQIILSRKALSRLTVPPNLWFGFQGIHESTSLVLNIANIEHDPTEVVKKNIHEINYNWESV